MKNSFALLVLLALALPSALGRCGGDSTYHFVEGICVKARLNDLPSTGSPSLSWDDAEAKCKKEGASLAIISSPSQLSSLTKYIDEYAQDVAGWSAWVGGFKENGKWYWRGYSPIPIGKHMWVTDRPVDSADLNHVAVIPAGPGNELRLSPASVYGAVGFVCQK